MPLLETKQTPGIHIVLKKLSVIYLCLFSNVIFAEYAVLAEEATISEISNNTGNGPNFFIKAVGGTGLCTGAQPTLIVFPLSAAGISGNDENLHNRAFSLALAAYASGSKVTVSGYEGSDCQRASRIKLVK